MRSARTKAVSPVGLGKDVIGNQRFAARFIGCRPPGEADRPTDSDSWPRRPVPGIRQDRYQLQAHANL